MSKYAGRGIELKASNASINVTSVAATDLFTAASNHGLAAGDGVVFDNLTGGTGLVEGTRYFVIAAGLTATVFAVSTTVGGSSFDHSSNVTAGSFSAFKTVGQVTALGPAGSSRDLIDGSAYGDDWKDYVVGQQDGSEIEIEIAYDPADTGHASMKSAYDAGTRRTLDMEHDEANFHVEFPVLLTKLERGGEKDGLLQMSCTAKILEPGVTDVA